MADRDEGPGVISTDDVGHRTCATTSLLDARRIMAFAAGINDTNPAYYDDTRPGGLLVHPGIAFSLQWQSRFQIDRRPNLRAAPYGVHAYTDLRMHQPFRQGDAITTQGTTIGRRQISPGVYSMDRYRMSNGRGELVAELDYNGIIRGGVLDGLDRVLEAEVERPDLPLQLSAEPCWTSGIHVAPHAAHQYTECADIYNPIHTERLVARAAGLPDIILHGSATQAIALSQVIDRCFDGDASRITRFAGRLRAMVLMSTRIEIQCLAEQTQGKLRHVFFRVLNQDGQPAVEGGLVSGFR